MEDANKQLPRRGWRGRPLTRTMARSATLMNLLGTPGLGSLLCGRWWSGGFQLLLVVAGFVLVVGWFVLLMYQYYRQISYDAPAPQPVAWIGESGAVLVIIAWIWSLCTSLSLLREARQLSEKEASNPQEPPS